MPRRNSRQKRAPARRGCVAVVDIGSNSLRLVIYDGIRRAPRTLFNEKVMCGLGRGLEATGKLDPDGVESARANLQRFVALARNLGARRLDVLATAAVRDASDGRAFVAEIERRHRLKVKVLAGAEEGRLSAFGVLAGIPEAAGVVGDLGGGSVELVPVAGGQVGAAATLPIGPLRLATLADDDRKLREIIDKHLASVSWLGSKVDGGAFYAVGGAWRALARIHMEQTRYPLHIIQHYMIPRSEAEDFLDIIARQSRKSLEKITTVSRKRLDVVPIAARVLQRLLRRVGPKHLVFSAFGLREGHVFSLLSGEAQREDPLLAACADLGAANRRFGVDGNEIFAWTSPLFAGESDASRRLRHAASLLCDLSWHEHPDYRADQALHTVLFMPVAGLDHAERAWLAAAVHARYGGNELGLDVLQGLLDEETIAVARVAGMALRLAFTLSGGVPGGLSRSRVGIEGNTLALTLSGDAAKRYGESVQRRLDALARSLGKRAEVRRG
ncbi:MAG TPA: Ppx/GppA family phosphatase [Stellaceae bacterium]|nr:Ppx/GppA family phosphatase [Stellaceae bacterium]